MPDAAEFRLPDLGEGVAEGEVVEWRVREGSVIDRDQVLCVIGTDKAAVEIPSPFAGRVEMLLAREGQVVRVGEVLLRVQPAGGGAYGSSDQPVALEGASAPGAAGVPSPASEFRLPDLGEGVTEGELVAWRVGEGAVVTRDQVLCVIGTDKATVEIPSPFAGRVERLLAREGQVVRVGDPLIRVRAGTPSGRSVPVPAARTEGPAERPTPAAAPAGTARVPALPSVRRAARQRGLRLEEMRGTGPRGRVRMADLSEGERRVPLRGARRVMAERLSEAHRRVPQVTVALDCEMDAAEALVRERGPVSILGLVCLATVAQVAEQPIFNTSLDEEAMEVVYHRQLDLGIAVQTDDGLKVATVRGAAELAPSALQREVDRLVAGAREGSLSTREVTGATFTISSGGRLGGLLATPIVNWPNVATLGIHEIQDRPVVRDGLVLPARCAVLSLSFDHRVIDGMTASAFLYAVVARLAAPGELLG